jgi:ribosomal protein S12 methylthiotransferase accessory factor
VTTLERPTFKAHVHAEIVPGEGLVLRSETGSHVLPGPLYALVASALDGCRTPDAIVAALAGRAGADEVRRTLAELEHRGYLAEGTDSVPVGDAAFWSLQGVDPQLATQRLSRQAVSIQSLGAIAAEAFLGALRTAGVRVSPDGARGIVLTDDYLRPELEAVNRAALDAERPWMLVRPVGCEIWLGPVFHPGRTGCWACLAQRLRDNDEIDAFLRRATRRDQLPPLARASTAATQQVAWSLAALATATWIARDEAPELEGVVLTLDVRSGRTRTHTLVQRPQCPACGDLPADPHTTARPIALRSRPKAFTRDGGHRALTPEATLERYGHHVSPITGAVSRLDRSSPPGNVVHSYVAGFNAALPPPNLRALRMALRTRSGGKGATDLQARASALGEALERYSGVFRGEEPRRHARLKDLGDAAIHPNACMGFSERQYREREAWNAAHSSKHRVPLPFDEDAPIHWTPLWSLTRRETRYLPTAYCFYGNPIVEENACCVVCSNGNAAGNSLEEAILQGFLELVERDSVALWWYNRVRRPAVALDSFEEPYLDAVRAYLEARGRELWVLDLMSDLAIPAFVALSRRANGPPEQILAGFGAHLDARIGVLRAVSELTQMLGPFLVRGGDAAHDQHPDDGDPLLARWFATATVADHPYLVPDPAQPARAADQYPRQWSDDLREDVITCQRRVEREGMEMLVLDQTRPDIGMPVVKVVVPGLRHFWPRFGPGRLYEVPARLGWRPAPATEDQLNPTAMPL